MKHRPEWDEIYGETFLGNSPKNVDADIIQPYVQFDYGDTAADKPIPSHYHQYWEIMHNVSSQPIHYLIGSERFELQPGDIICLPPNTLHCALISENIADRYRRHILWMSQGFAAGLLSYFPRGQFLQHLPRYLLRISGPHQKRIARLFEWGSKENERKAPGWEMLLVSIALQLLTELERSLTDNQIIFPDEPEPSTLDKVVQYIEENYRNPISLQDVADSFFIGKSTICHMFTNQMGISFYRYITQRRLMEAEILMRQNFSMEEIYPQVGFHDYTAFYKAFKQKYGMSPKEYRSKLPRVF